MNFVVKGFALGVMVDILSGALSGGGCSQSTTCRLGNAMFFQVIDIEKFVSQEEFLEQVAVLKEYLLGSPPAPVAWSVVATNTRSPSTMGAAASTVPSTDVVHAVVKGGAIAVGQAPA